MIDIPENTRDTTDGQIAVLVERCVKCFERTNVASISWRETTQAIARKVAMMFAAKGYHASEYITRDRGWSCTEISTFPQQDESAMMSYVRVIA